MPLRRLKNIIRRIGSKLPSPDGISACIVFAKKPVTTTDLAGKVALRDADYIYTCRICGNAEYLFDVRASELTGLYHRPVRVVASHKGIFIRRSPTGSMFPWVRPTTYIPVPSVATPHAES